MENNRKQEDRDILLRVLTTEEIELLKEAYAMYKSLNNKDHKILLLRRIDDVISMARFTDMSDVSLMSSNFEHLYDRMNNLRIAINNIKNPITTESTFNYLADRTKTPLILHSIEYLDNQRHQEIGFLLETLAHGDGKEQDGELRQLVGGTYHLIFTRRGPKVMIYDIDSNERPKIKPEELPRINERCGAAIRLKSDGTIQTIYDEIVYQAVNFNMPTNNIGYRLIKSKGKER